MKDIYIGYSKKTPEELEDLWKNSLITFDTNVLLNLYRYSNETRNSLIDLISKFEEKIFLTYQVGKEFNKNRYEVISQQEKDHAKFILDLNEIEKKINSKDKTPFLSSKLSKSITEIFKKIHLEIDKEVTNYKSMFQEDEIYNKISTLFEDKITNEYKTDKLEDLFIEGKKRYEKKIPPGYSDDKKPSNEKFGDLIVWKQILEKSITEKKSIIFITDEMKEDWIWKLKDGQIIGPRQELVNELKQSSGKDFHIYSTDRFLEFGQIHFDKAINQNIINEIKNLTPIERFEKKTIRNHNEFRRIKYLIENVNEKTLEKLTPLEADILRLSLGINEEKLFTDEEISKIFDLEISLVSKIRRSSFNRAYYYLKNGLNL